MRIDGLDVVGGDLLERAWHLYETAFADLRTAAVQRHVMHRSEFDEMMRDRRVRKFVAYTAQGTLCGLSTFTNRLDAVPLISPDYFQARFPGHFAAAQIWYVGFVAVLPAGRQPQVFERLITAMRHHGGDQLAMVVIDVCRLNDEQLGLADAVGTILRRRFGDVHRDSLDAQTYYGYTFPPDQIAPPTQRTPADQPPRTPPPSQPVLAPGHETLAPGNAALAPGIAAPVPSNANLAPGHAASVPGNANLAPGDAASVPGNANLAPGHAVPAPGNATLAPGIAAPVPGQATPAPDRVRSP